MEWPQIVEIRTETTRKTPGATEEHHTGKPQSFGIYRETTYAKQRPETLHLVYWKAMLQWTGIGSYTKLDTWSTLFSINCETIARWLLTR